VWKCFGKVAPSAVNITYSFSLSGVDTTLPKARDSWEEKKHSRLKSLLKKKNAALKLQDDF